MRLPQSNAMLALYEAVVNSIHAILDGPEPNAGKITIGILRGGEQLTMDDKPERGPIVGFYVQDNGVGFNDRNFESFCCSDSTTKAKYGGKGVGRFLWLKVFSDVAISSVYEDDTGNKNRAFSFSVDGISSSDLADTTDKRSTKVTVKLPQSTYEKAIQHEPDTIAVGIIQHCLEFFVSNGVPTILLVDAKLDINLDLGKLFRDDLQSEIKRNDFHINGATFQITHLLVKGRKNAKHSLHFCAHSRRVKDEGLSGKIPALMGALRLPDKTEELIYQGYVSGELLNEIVGVERSSFDFDGLFAYDPNNPPEGYVSFETLLGNAIEESKKFLEPVLNPIIEESQRIIRTKIETHYPQYRYLLKHRSADISTIAPGTEGKDLDIALYKIEQKLDIESRESLANELSKTNDPDETPDDRKTRLDTLLAQINDSGTAKLARHVAYRRAVIEFLDDQIGLQHTGKYTLEEAVHAAVCPTKTTSDDTPLAQMNLWLLDDRLYFHYYLASDMPFKEMKDTVQQDSQDRPDLAIFHRPMAFSDSLDQIGSVVLVEFKRPVRDDYNADDPKKNPVSQVLKYITTLKAGEGRKAKGQAIHIQETTPFYAYIVADFTKSLRDLATREDFMPTPDGDGYFRFFQNFNCYVEMLSYQKMIRDAKKRNQAFFDKLGIPIHS